MSFWRFLLFSLSTALSSRSVAPGVKSGATKNCAKRSSVGSRHEWTTSKWKLVFSIAVKALEEPSLLERCAL